MADVLPADTSSEESDFGSLRPGTRLGRYELLVPVARGGMARVWAARQHGQHGFNKLVAIKTILPHLAVEPEFERMFLDEARIASGVHHPNVCEIYELGEDEQTLYLAMEWVSGDSLARLLKASGKVTPIDPRVAARIVADACAGVHAAHELTDEDGKPLGVVHRDLSPHNVLLTTDGTAKVCDFGVAKALGQLHDQTSAGELKGKIAYMSPEQITGGLVDRRSDVFSMGCVLYEATTGARPFKGQDHQAMYAILHDELEPPSKVIRSYPSDLEKVVLRALAHKPAERFESAERMRFALEEFLTRGQLVTQSNVAQTVRARLGDEIDKRKEKIKEASSKERRESDPSLGARTRAPADQKSSVQQVKTGAAPARLSEAEEARANADTKPPPGVLPRLDEEDFDDSTEQRAAEHQSSTLVMVNPFAPPEPLSPEPARRPEFDVPAAPPMASGHAPQSYANPAMTPRPYVGHAPFTPPGPFPPPRLPGEEEPSGIGQYAVAALVGLVLAVLIGGGGFLIWHARTNQAAPAPTSAPHR